MHPTVFVSAAGLFIASFSVAAMAAGTTGAAASDSGRRVTVAEDGQPRAEIVVADTRPRMVTLAALELRHYAEKISGARLPIVTRRTGRLPIAVYLGESAATRERGISSDGLRYGAFRIGSGADWLAVVGHDFDFQPPVPWPMSRGDVPRAIKEWEKLIAGKSDAPWGFPFTSGFKSWWNPANFEDILAQRYGADGLALWNAAHGSQRGWWNEDESGTLCGVYELLQSLGVRWYMPGDIGEVVPKLASIAISGRARTAAPDFAERSWQWYNFAGFSFDDIIWARRLGMNSGYEKRGLLRGPHGLVAVYTHPAMQKAHPEYYALVGGKRDTEHRGFGTPCFSSPGLVAETVRYLRFIFDTYDFPSADIWPGDGLKSCECTGCKGKPLTELVWTFAERVAREMQRTHPQKLIMCGAYTSYAEAPESIVKFSPNLGVSIANAGRPLLDDPEHWTAYWERLERWRNRIAPGNLMRLENNRYSIWGEAGPIGFPVIHPRAMAKDLQALRGVSFGERNEEPQKANRWHAPGADHLTLYVQARFLWKADQDIERLLDEYFTGFYGPAAAAMREAITFAEQNYSRKDQSRSRGRGDPRNATLAAKLRLRELLARARDTAGETIYGRRIDGLLSELQPREQVIAEHREKDEALAKLRANAPVAVASGPAGQPGAVYSLRHNTTGGEPAAKTTFRASWDGSAICFDIRCEEPGGTSPASNAGGAGGNDAVVVMLETPLHSYYHLEIDREGRISEGNPGPNWRSLANVQHEHGSDFWRVRLRIPVVGAEEAQSDPHHRVAGAEPTRTAPWYFNVGRSRTMAGKPELQAFSPTGSGWHVPAKFARLVSE